MAAAMQSGSSSGADPFAKVRELISDMIAKLEKDAGKDASHKAYCDKEMGETEEKEEQKKTEIEKLTTGIDSDSSQSQKLKDEVATIQEELAKMASEQAEATKIRQEEHAQYEANKPEMEGGLEGVKMALKILREYYSKDAAHDAAEGAGSGIIAMLEVVESDFSKLLAEMTAMETTSQADYDREKKENQIEKATKDQDIKYKSKEFKQLDNEVAEAKQELSGVQQEQALGTLRDSYCNAKPSPCTEQDVVAFHPYKTAKGYFKCLGQSKMQ